LKGIQFGNEGLHLLIGGEHGGDGDRCHVKKLRKLKLFLS
jgi:hypothetical protein